MEKKSLAGEGIGRRALVLARGRVEGGGDPIGVCEGWEGIVYVYVRVCVFVFVHGKRVGRKEGREEKAKRREKEVPSKQKTPQTRLFPRMCNERNAEEGAIYSQSRQHQNSHAT